METENYYLFYPSTTGLNRPKKSKPFESFDDALQAGFALNMIEGKKDRIFVVLSSKDMKAFTQLTGELPFSPSFFRFNRLSDSANKFQSQEVKTSLDVDLDNIPEKFEKFMINPIHPSTLLSEENKAKSLMERLLEIGLSRENIHKVQNLIQTDLKYTILDHQPDPTEFNIKLILEDHFQGLELANKYIFNLIDNQFDFSGVDEKTGEPI